MYGSSWGARFYRVMSWRLHIWDLSVGPQDYTVYIVNPIDMVDT